jgi:hypothetical protein
MNYQRIYNDFIADRRIKEQTLTGYSEKHHILPRSLGGLDSAENLIRISADDHLMAHMLLAKIHGGIMWHALNSMALPHRNSMRSSLTTTKRLRLAYAMRAANYGAAVKVQFNDAEFRQRHADATSKGTAKAFTDPVTKARHQAALLASRKSRGIGVFRQDAHVKAYKQHLLKIRRKEVGAENGKTLKSKYAAGELIGFRAHQPSSSVLSEAQKKRAKNESVDLRRARGIAMHTPEAIAKRKETIRSSEAWAAFQERNRQPKPNQSGENHWRAKKRRAEMEAA